MAKVAKVKPIPDEYPRLIPYLSIDGAGAAIEFYVSVFGAKERMRMPGPDGRIGHAELEIGESVLMLADAFPEVGGQTPEDLGGTPVTMMLYVEDVDVVVDRAVEAGVQQSSARSRTSSMETGRDKSSIRSATNGSLRRTWRMFRPKRWRSVPPRR